MFDYSKGVIDFANILLKYQVIDKSVVKRIQEQLLENNEIEIYPGNDKQVVNLSQINERRNIK